MNDLSTKIAKLPRWAQDHIKRLQQQRDAAVVTLQEWEDHQTEAPFYTDEMICDGGLSGLQYGPSSRRRYFQARKMEVVHGGVCLEIILRDSCLQLSYEGLGHEVALIPEGHQTVRLVAKDAMR